MVVGQRTDQRLHGLSISVFRTDHYSRVPWTNGNRDADISWRLQRQTWKFEANTTNVSGLFEERKLSLLRLPQVCPTRGHTRAACETAHNNNCGPLYRKKWHTLTICNFEKRNVIERRLVLHSRDLPASMKCAFCVTKRAKREVSMCIAYGGIQTQLHIFLTLALIGKSLLKLFFRKISFL